LARDARRRATAGGGAKIQAEAQRGRHAVCYPLIAAYLLTGGGEKEVLGLEVDDVSFDREVLTIRPNQWRRLKTDTLRRSVRIWPQLREILQAYMYGGETPRVTGLLFPSMRGTAESMIRDVRKMLDAVAQRAGWKAGEIRTRAFRHTYTATRLQTLDEGTPVSVYTVARELGHGGDALVKRITAPRSSNTGSISTWSDSVTGCGKFRPGRRLSQFLAQNARPKCHNEKPPTA
jgi:integrase